MWYAHNMLLISLDFILVPNVVCFSVPFTELHKHAYTVLLLMWYKCVLFTKKVWKFNLLQSLHSIVLPSFVHVSFSISELHQRAYSHCSLLWCKKGIIYQQDIRILMSYPIYLFTKFHASPSIQVRELHKHAWPINLWAEVVFHGFPKSSVDKNVNMPIPCMSPNSIPLPIFICGFTPVVEIRKFNQDEDDVQFGLFQFDTFTIVQMDPFFNQT